MTVSAKKTLVKTSSGLAGYVPFAGFVEARLGRAKCELHLLYNGCDGTSAVTNIILVHGFLCEDEQSHDYWEKTVDGVKKKGCTVYGISWDSVSAGAFYRKIFGAGAVGVEAGVASTNGVAEEEDGGGAAGGAAGAIAGVVASAAADFCAAAKKAQTVGKELAKYLIGKASVNQIQGNIVLVGHSLGARVVVFCLAELVEQNQTQLVKDAVLLAGAVSSHFEATQHAVTGKLINIYSPGDEVLAYGYGSYRKLPGVRDGVPCGLQEIASTGPKVVNFQYTNPFTGTESHTAIQDGQVAWWKERGVAKEFFS
jgi:hypothetical protein